MTWYYAFSISNASVKSADTPPFVSTHSGWPRVACGLPPDGETFPEALTVGYPAFDQPSVSYCLNCLSIASASDSCGNLAPVRSKITNCSIAFVLSPDLASAWAR